MGVAIMMDALKLKPNFAQSVKRFEAWWHGELADGMPICLNVAPSRAYRGPKKEFASHRERWFDAQYVVESAIGWMESCDYVSDSFPIFMPNMGPEVTGTLYGVDLEFSEYTSWSKPIVHGEADWQAVLQKQADFTNPYWQQIERMTDLALQACDGRYLVGITDLHGNYDILASLREPQELCMDVLDCPELLRKVGRHVTKGFVQAFERSYAKLSQAGMGSVTWTPSYHAGRMYVPSCDFWCMLSPEVGREMVWPDIWEEMKPLERRIFLLDGINALPHLPLLLECKQLTAVQWVYGAGHGPASQWLEVYQRCLRAGKSIQVMCETKADGVECVKALGQRGVWLMVFEGFKDNAEAEAYLRQIRSL